MSQPTRLASRNPFGSYSLSAEGNLLFARFEGVVNENLAQRYQEDIYQLVETFQGRPWAYVFVAEKFDATTRSSFETLVEVYRYCRQRQCMIAVYNMTSALGKAQIRSMLEAAGLCSELDQVLFDSERDAAEFAQHFLEAI